MVWMLLGAVAWVPLALPLALTIGRGLRVADRREAAARRLFPVPDFIPDYVMASVNEARRNG